MAITVSSLEEALDLVRSHPAAHFAPNMYMADIYDVWW